ncbi:MAG: argininosuccinate synthase [Desulfovibrio sp.]|nr:argininosuccinate synthase [Desulfovibrio sp.]
MKTIKKIVLAYSGGLDTSVILKWLIEAYHCEVITVTADLGQPEDLSGVEEKALKTGASKAFVLDLKEEMAKDFVFPMLRGAAIYEGRYLLGTSIARPIIAKALVDVARQEGADAVAHGATGKGNDQVRFELSVNALAPDIQVVAPWREWDLMSRTALTAFAEKHGIYIPQEAKRYSMDANMLHTSFEGSELEDPGQEPDASCHQRCVPMEEAPNTPERISVEFEAGNPVAVNGQRLSPYQVIKTLTDIAGRHGIGRLDMVENRFVGMKCRGVYEDPAGALLYALHRDLEGICMDREVLGIRDMLAVRYAQCIYNGFWYAPEREALQAFMDKSQETVTGKVTAKLYKGGVWPLCRTSPYSLFSADLATFEGGNYDHHDAQGFIRLNSLRLKLASTIKQQLAKEAQH